MSALFLLLGWLGAGAGYPGGPDECLALDDCYCETVEPGPIAQPANTWSNLAYVAVGFAILADVRRRRRRTDRVALIDREPAYGVLLGITAIGIGIGSFAFHGSMRAWGGFADLLAMHLYLGAIVAYDLVRIHGWGLRRGLAVWSVFGIGSAALLLLLPPQHGRVLFGVLVAVTLLVEAAVSFPALRPWERRVLRPNRVPWFWAGMVSFAAAFVVWNLSRTGGVWCDPASLWQGHALWHFLTAATVWCLHRYFCAERPAAIPDRVRTDSVGGDG